MCCYAFTLKLPPRGTRPLISKQDVLRNVGLNDSFNPAKDFQA
jgi:hypothetical protein